MEQLIKTIKNNREELILEYSKIKREVKVLSEGIKQATKLGKNDVCNNLWMKRSKLNEKEMNVGMAINDLTNALNHLGEKIDVFRG